MHCLLHLNESLNLEGFLSLSHLENASLGPLWSFNYQDRNDRFPTLSYSSNNETSISTHVLFYLMQEFAYSFNHAAANRLTE